MGTARGIGFIDSTSLKVCHNRRIFSHRVFNGIAKRGRSSALQSELLLKPNSRYLYNRIISYYNLTRDLISNLIFRKLRSNVCNEGFSLFYPIACNSYPIYTILIRSSLMGEWRNW